MFRQAPVPHCNSLPMRAAQSYQARISRLVRAWISVVSVRIIAAFLIILEHARTSDSSQDSIWSRASLTTSIPCVG
jgi:hypothetical protein